MSDVFDIPENLCGSVEDAVKRVRIKAKSFGLPFWVLKEKASGIEVDFITEFVKLLNQKKHKHFNCQRQHRQISGKR